MKRILTVEGDPGDTAAYREALREFSMEALFGSTLDGVAGLLLMGGTDVNPSLYGGARHPQAEDPDDRRDRIECALIAEALDRDVPILAICRGLQILNVQQGGTLIQHLEPVERHRSLPEDKSRNAHCIEITPGTELARIAGGDLHREVNSRHHQAIARLGEGLIVSARDPGGGVIEAVERPDRRFVIGVKWHPENQIAAGDSIARRLFEAFSAALI